MPKRILGVSSRVIECAKSEFKSKGFRDASIREIAQKANTSPRAIYTRFPDKEGLFHAIVETAYSGLLSMLKNNSSGYWNIQKTNPDKIMFSRDSANYYHQMVDYIYEHKDEFILLVKYSEGTRYDNFIEQLTDTNCAYLRDFYGENKDDEFEITMKMVHMITHSFYSGLFEPLLHEMDKDEAQFFVHRLCLFFIYGVKGTIENG